MNEQQDKALPKGHRLGFLYGVGLLMVIAVIFINSQADLEQNFKAWILSLVGLLTLLLVFIWFLFLSRFNWRWRLLTTGLLLVGGFALRQMVRVDGTTSGTGLPRLVWKWTSPKTVRFEPAMTKSQPSLSLATNVPGLVDTPQFFGPNRDGILTGNNLERDWKTHAPKELWRQPVGLGWSAFAVVGGCAYTQEQRGEAELVTCYDVITGRLLWAHTNIVRFSQWQGGEGPRATPTVIGGRVFTLGAAGNLNCLDATNGAPVWSHEILKENNLPNLVWGVSCSPLVFDDTVVVSGGLSKGPSLLAYQSQTGEPLWRSGTDKSGYSSPLLVKLAGHPCVISVNAASLTAHDPKTGAILLDYPWTTDKWPKASQPLVLEGDRVFLSAGYGAGCVMLQIKPGTNGLLAATELWRNNNLKTQFNSAAVRNGYLYGLDDGACACVEVATGQRKWKGGKYGSGQTLLVDDLILIQGERGEVALVQAVPDEFHELAQLPALSSKTWNYPTLAGRYLLVRNDQEAVCYELPMAAPESKSPGISQ
jgi:outer membrane protein assembly factor BamB